MNKFLSFLVALILSVSAFSAVITCVKCNTQFDDRYTHGCGRNSDGSISIFNDTPEYRSVKAAEAVRIAQQAGSAYVYNPFTKTFIPKKK